MYPHWMSPRINDFKNPPKRARWVLIRAYLFIGGPRPASFNGHLCPGHTKLSVLVSAVKLMGIMFRIRCWFTTFHTTTVRADIRCQKWLVWSTLRISGGHTWSKIVGFKMEFDEPRQNNVGFEICLTLRSWVSRSVPLFLVKTVRFQLWSKTTFLQVLGSFHTRT
jgi:hypothetical protein